MKLVNRRLWKRVPLSAMLAVCTAAFASFGMHARAAEDVVVSNLTQTVDSFSEVYFSETPTAGQSFSANQPFYLESVYISILNYSDELGGTVGDGNFTLGLYADNAGALGQQLRTFSGESNPFASGIYNYKLSNPFEVSANTQYWVGARVSSGDGFYFWDFTTSSASTGRGQLGPSVSDDVVYQDRQIMAVVAAAPTPTPQPGTWRGWARTDNWSDSNWEGVSPPSVRPPSDGTADVRFIPGARTSTSVADQAWNVKTLNTSAETNYALSGQQLVVQSGVTVAQNANFAVSNDLILPAAQTWAVAGGAKLEASGRLNGGSELTKSGAGSLFLTGNNTSLTGGIVVIDGNLTFGSPQSWGASSNVVTLRGGSLALSESMTVNNRVQVETGGIFVDNIQTLTMNGVLSGAGNLVKTGGGSLVLNRSNTLSGVTVEDGGLVLNGSNSFSSVTATRGGVSVRSASALGVGSVNLSGGAYLAASASFTASQSLSVNGSAGVSVSPGDTLTWNGSLSGDGSIAILGGTFAYAGTNVSGFTGRFNVSGTFAPNAALLGAGSNINLSGGVLRISSDFGGMLSGDGNLETQGDRTFSGTMGGSITKTGSGNLVLAGSGFTASPSMPSSFGVAQGTVFVNSEAAISGLSQLNVGANGVLDLNGRNASIGALNGSAGGRLILGGGSLSVTGGSFGGNLTGAGSLTLRTGSEYYDTRFLSLSGNNTGASIGITVQSGTALTFQSDAALPGSALIRTEAGGYTETAVAMTQAFVNRFDKAATNGTLGFVGEITENLNFTGFGAGMRLGASYDSSIGAGVNLTPPGSTYRFGRGDAILGGGTLTIAANLVGERSVNVANGLVKLEGTNTFTQGVVAESGGRILFMNSGSLPSQGFFTSRAGGYIGLGFNNGNPQQFIDRLDKASTAGTIGFDAPNVTGTIDLTGFSESVQIGTTSFTDFAAEIIPQGDFYRFGGGSGTLKVTAALTGDRGVVIAPGPNVQLTGANTYTRNTTVFGSLNVASDTALGAAGSSLVLSGGSFVVTENVDTTRRIVAGGSLGASTSKTLTLRGEVGGNARLDFSGGGTVVMATNATYTQGSYLSGGGVLRNALDNALPATGGLTINSGRYELAGHRQTLTSVNSSGVIDLGGGELRLQSAFHATSDYNGTIIGAGRLIVDEGSRLRLGGANTFTADLEIRGGTVSFGSTLALGSTSAPVTLNGGDLEFSPNTSKGHSRSQQVVQSVNVIGSGSGVYVYSGDRLELAGGLSGGGGLDKLGQGTLSIGNAPNYSGVVAVRDGTLEINGVAPTTDVEVGTGSRLAGAGSFSDATFGEGSVLSPGGPDTVAVLSAQTARFMGGVDYEWDLRSVMDSGNDRLVVSGGIDLLATALNPIKLSVATGLFDDKPAPLAGFDNRGLYQWTLISTATVAGFNPNLFTIDTEGFGHVVNPDAFYVVRGEEGVLLRYDVGRIGKGEVTTTQAVKAGQAIAGNVTLGKGLGTEAVISGGSKQTTGFVTLTLTERDGFEESELASDVLTIEGTNGIPIVLQLTYDEAAAIALFGAEDKVRLGWLDTFDGSWKLAVVGNSGTGDLGSFYAMSYDEFLAEKGGVFDPVTMLGAYGVDVVSDRAWAVIDHNSDFAVLDVIPEPSTYALLLLGAGVAFLISRRKKRGV